MVTRKTRLQITIAVLVLLLLGTLAVLVPYFLSQRETLVPTPTEAALPNVVVSPQCNASGNVVLNFSITLQSASPCKDVIVRDLQTDQKQSFNNVCSTQPITGSFTTTQGSLNSGIIFVETFNTGSSPSNPTGYQKVKKTYAPHECTAPTPTDVPTPTPEEPTPTPEEEEPSPTPTPTMANQCPDTLPDTPELLTVAKSGTNSVTLTWTQPDANVEYYLISYGTESGNYIYGVPNTGKTTSYQVNNLDLSKTYYFVVRSQKGCAASEASNEIEFTPESGPTSTPGANPTPTPTPTQTVAEATPTLPVAGSSTPVVVLSTIISVVVIAAVLLLL